jgi:hypothetical protein
VLTILAHSLAALASGFGMAFRVSMPTTAFATLIAATAVATLLITHDFLL